MSFADLFLQSFRFQMTVKSVKVCQSHQKSLQERYRTAFTDLGEYRSPGVYVSLMGLKHNSHTPRVLPESAKPFLKSLTPNFQALDRLDKLDKSGHVIADGNAVVRYSEVFLFSFSILAFWTFRA